MDSGVRRGIDVVKAIALGANYVAIGRPALFGACAGGERGARRALEILIDEIERAMKLCGAPDIQSIQSSLVMSADRGSSDFGRSERRHTLAAA